jgi:hypothetical protein
MTHQTKLAKIIWLYIELLLFFIYLLKKPSNFIITTLLKNKEITKT